MTRPLARLPLLAAFIALPVFAAHDHGGGGAAADDGDPGAVKMMCHAMGDMPPHYCAPAYKAASSVPGIVVEKAEPMGERSLMVTLKALPGVTPPKTVLVGGGGSLAGGQTIAGGWKERTTIHLDLSGDGSIYRQKSLHLHLWPNTGK
jgi:hypothetical protein